MIENRFHDSDPRHFIFFFSSCHQPSYLFPSSLLPLSPSCLPFSPLCRAPQSSASQNYMKMSSGDFAEYQHHDHYLDFIRSLNHMLLIFSPSPFLSYSSSLPLSLSLFLSSSLFVSLSPYLCCFPSRTLFLCMSVFMHLCLFHR